MFLDKQRRSLQRLLTLYNSSFVETQRSNDFARVKTITIYIIPLEHFWNTHLDMYQVYISMSLYDLSNHFVPYLSQVLQPPRLASLESSPFDQSEWRFCKECEKLNLIMKSEWLDRSAPMLFRSSRWWAWTTFDATPKWVRNKNISPNCLSINEMIALCV